MTALGRMACCRRTARCPVGIAGLVALAVCGIGCSSSPGYRPPLSPEDYTLLVLEPDSLSLGVAAVLAEEGFEVRDSYQGGERAAAAVMIFPFEEQIDVRVVDTRSGTALVALVVALRDLPADSIGLGRAVGDLVAQAVRRPR